MRTWMGLAFVLAGVSVGCSDGDSKKAGDAGEAGATGEDNSSNGDGISAGGNPEDATVDPYPKCDRTQTPKELEGYTGEKPAFSMENLTACQMKCGNDDACYVEAECPGIDLFSDCSFENLLACTGSEGKACRLEIENFDCCLGASGCDLDSEDRTCVQDKCANDITALRDCYGADRTCLQSARAQCLGTGVTPTGDGGMAMGGAAANGDTGGKARAASATLRFGRRALSSSNMLKLLR